MVILLVLLVFFSTKGFTKTNEENPTRLALVHSYHESYSWVDDINKGIMLGLLQNGFFEGRNLELQTYYMHTKDKNTVHSQKVTAGNEIVNSIIQENNNKEIPLIITSDDDAFTYVVPHLYQSFPIVFHGISILPEVYNSSFYFFDDRKAPGHNITGVAKTTPFVETILLFNRVFDLSFSRKTFLLLFDSTITGNAFKQQYEEEIISQIGRLQEFNITIVSKQVSTFEEYKTEITKLNNDPTYSGVYPLVFSLGSDSSESYTAAEIYTWTGNNCMKPSFGLTASFCQYGILGGLGISAFDSGYQTGLIAGKYLRGIIPSLGDVAFEMNPRMTMFFNLDTAAKIGLTIEQFYLDQASAIFYTPNNTLLYLLLVGVPMLVVSSVFIVVMTVLVTFFLNCARIQRKKTEWMTLIAENIANMDLENDCIVDLEKIYTKKGKIGKVFIKIVRKLKEFKPYLPSALFLQDEEQEDDGPTSLLSMESVSSSKYSDNSYHSGASTSSAASSKLKSITSSMQSRKTRMKKLGLSLTKKQISVLMCKLHGFSEMLKSDLMSPDHVLRVVNDYISIVSVAIKSSFGNLNFVQGSTIIVSYNAARSQPSTHPKKACDSAIAIREAFEKEQKNWLLKGVIDKALELRQAINTEVCFSGNTGTTTIRNFNIIGGGAEGNLIKLCKLNAKYKTKIIVNDNCYDSIKFGFNTRCLDVWKEKVVHELVSSKGQIDQNEWLYEFDNLEKKDKYKLYNSAFYKMMEKKFDEAKVDIQSFLNNLDDEEDVERGNYLLKKIQSNSNE